jgi:hypothetical protein
MLSTLLNKLRIATDEAELKSWKIGEDLNLETCFNYTLFGEDGLMQGSVFLLHESNIYSNLSLTVFSLAPATSSEGVFWQEASKEILIHFHVNFAEGEAVDSLKGTLTLLDCLLPENQGSWEASVRALDCEVAKVKGTWLRSNLDVIKVL